MKRKYATGIAALLLLVFAAGCNYPGMTAPTPFVFPTADMTMTAVFAPTGTEQAAATATEENLPAEPGVTSTTAPATSSPPGGSPTSQPQVTNTTQPPTQAPAATRTATGTQQPASSSGPSARRGTSITAAYLRDRPTLDGSFDEWTLDRYRIESVVAGSSSVSGLEDLSGRAMFGWDEENLYIAVRVLDDVYVQEASGEDLFKGDSIEILLDTDVPADYYVQSLSPDDFQLGISPGAGEPGVDPEAYLWYPSSIRGSRSRVRVGAMRTDEGYRLEAAIPWSTFEVTPRSGQHFGFAFSISDNDRRGEAVQQSMVSSSAARELTDPTTWGDLTLGGAPAPSNPTPTPGSTTGALEAVYTSQAPDINANLGDWSSGRYDVNAVVFGGGSWTGPSDLSGDLRLAWDEDNLYLAVRVFDDVYVQTESGRDLFLGDSLEILLDRDLAADAQVRSLSPDDFQLGISPGSPAPGDNPNAYLWYPQNSEGARSQVRSAARRTDDGYIVEAAVPWSVFGIDPKEGDEFGFVFSISDNDSRSTARQESMTATTSGRVLTDPTTWGRLKLTAP
jgi:hypothetical protein